MTLLQLKYFIAIVEQGSINAAARHLYSSQSNLSTAIKEIEKQYELTLFERSNRGISLTKDGAEFLVYARQVVEQYELMDSHFKHDKAVPLRLAVSSQHYAFCAQAFIKTIDEYQDKAYEFVLKETRTYENIDDVANFRSEIGVLYLDDDNRRVLEKAFVEASVVFHPLFTAQPHVFLGKNHPLAKKKLIKPSELDEYPRYAFQQGVESSFFYAEEPFSRLPVKQRIFVSDRGTLTDLLTDYHGYTISTGVRSTEMMQKIVSIPLDTDMRMTVGYIIHTERQPSVLLQSFIDNMRSIIRKNKTVNEYKIA
ncbi:MAG: LysR family transcriptional regulator [Coriobacteriia bacterium]|nr:LysR family transcriptional regulator [Coriobacteriia bacterium]